MTPQEFQIALGPQLKEILQSTLGQAAISVVNAMKPNYESSPHEHIFLENRGAVRGYEMCMRNIVALSFVPVIKPEAEQNYGVKEADPKATPPAPVYQVPSIQKETV